MNHSAQYHEATKRAFHKWHWNSIDRCYYIDSSLLSHFVLIVVERDKQNRFPSNLYQDRVVFGAKYVRMSRLSLEVWVKSKHSEWAAVLPEEDDDELSFLEKLVDTLVMMESLGTQ